MEISIGSAAPFFALIAPENTVSFDFVERRTVPFYEAVFTGLDVVSAHEKHLAPSFKRPAAEQNATSYLRAGWPTHLFVR